MSISTNNDLRLARAEARAAQQAATMPGIQAAATIAFVTMAESGALDEVTAMEHMDAFAAWAPNVAYVVGNLRTHGEGENAKLYKCVQAHTSQSAWTPPATTSL